MPIVPPGIRSNAVARVTVQLLKIEPLLHCKLRMPVVVRTKQLVVVLPEDIECAVNLQHDCHFGKCVPHISASVQTLQEREATSITRARICHSDDDRFIVNMAALHNYHQISSAIPASVGVHSFTVQDQTALRISAAAQIRDKIPGNTDDPMSLASQAAESEPRPPGVTENCAGPDEEHTDDLELGRAAEAAAVLEAPVFSRVGAGVRARNQQLRQAPTTLYAFCSDSRQTTN
ncbi:hypothetical protein B0H10DRAFT_1901751 [Mycena sp. CBHHK59/15]|nr:hypothetical protein B0H10DRAFT_1901751 [Mycena sp. CBHHK59/15]